MTFRFLNVIIAVEIVITKLLKFKEGSNAMIYSAIREIILHFEHQADDEFEVLDKFFKPIMPM